MDKIFYLNGLGFVWDDKKYSSNLRKHGITFEEAAEVFFDQFHVFGDASVFEEDREFVLGYSNSSRLLFVVSVERGSRTRIISARRAGSQETKEYAKQFR